MAVVEQTRYEYTGNGVTREFPVVFKYLRDSDVVVQVNGQNVAYTFSQGNSFVRLAVVPSAGATVVVQRSTEARNPLHEFQHGSPLVPGYLDENFKQVLYTVSEAASDTAAAFAAADAAEQAASGAEQAALDAVQAAGEAGAKAVAAQNTANTAVQKADAAQSTANTAVQKANTADAKAVAAQSTADTAVQKANAAQSTADTAVWKANAADGKALQAQSTADTALFEAAAAYSRASVAINTANAAAQDAQHANLVAANAALSANSAQLQAGAANQAAQEALAQIEDAVSGGVASFNGRTGAVLPKAGDYSAEQITGLGTAATRDVGTDDGQVMLAEDVAAAIDNAVDDVMDNITADTRPVLADSSVDLNNIDPDRGTMFYRTRYGNPGGTWPMSTSVGSVVYNFAKPKGQGSAGEAQLGVTLDASNSDSVGRMFIRYKSASTQATWAQWTEILTDRRVPPHAPALTTNVSSWGGRDIPTWRNVLGVINAQDPNSSLMYNRSYNRVEPREWQLYYGSAINTGQNRGYWNRSGAAVAIRMLLQGPSTLVLGMAGMTKDLSLHSSYVDFSATKLSANTQQTIEIVLQPGEAFRYSSPSPNVIVNLIKYTTTPHNSYDFPADPFQLVNLS